MNQKKAKQMINDILAAHATLIQQAAIVRPMRQYYDGTANESMANARKALTIEVEALLANFPEE
jgi:phosphopantetheine adenylyltransferase